MVGSDGNSLANFIPQGFEESGNDIFYSSGIDEFKSIPRGPQRILLELSCTGSRARNSALFWS